MKKLALILTLTLFAISTYAQEPTKQETIDWIGSKLEQYGKDSYETSVGTTTDGSQLVTSKFSYNQVNYQNGGKVVYTCNEGRRDWFQEGKSFYPATPYKIVIINLADIYAVEVIEKEGKKSLTLTGKEVWTSREYKAKEDLNSSNSVSSTWWLNAPKLKADDPKNYYVSRWIDFDAEPDLFNRMLKAFQTLVKYNNANRPKEKF